MALHLGLSPPGGHRSYVVTPFVGAYECFARGIFCASLSGDIRWHQEKGSSELGLEEPVRLGEAWRAGSPHGEVVAGADGVGHWRFLLPPRP